MRRWLQRHKREIPLYASGLIVLSFLPELVGLVPGIPLDYVFYLISLGLIYAIVAIGLDLLFGYAGQFSLGHAGFFAIGAYTSALLTAQWGVPFLLGLLAGGFFTAAIGFLVGLPCLRLSGPYLAVATLGFGLAVPQFVVWQGSWTGGSMGLHSLPLAAISLGQNASIVFRTDQEYYYLALAVLILLTILARNIVASDTGRALISIRDSELAARAMGVNLLRYKTTAFALSAFYAGLGGSLYAHLLHGISPEDFTVFLSIDLITMIVLGGLGTITGALLGALLLTLLENLLTQMPVLRDLQNLYIVALGLILILIITFLPGGIVGAWHNLRVNEPARPLEAVPRTLPARATEPGRIVESRELVEEAKESAE